MNVVLVKDVERLGVQGSVVAVKSGYARNYLIPTGLALPATTEYLRVLEQAKQQKQHKTERIREKAFALKRKIESRSVTVKLSLGEGDKPFGSVTIHDVMHALSQEQFKIEKHAILLEQPIKALGIYEIPIRLHPEVTATLKL